MMDSVSNGNSVKNIETSFWSFINEFYTINTIQQYEVIHTKIGKSKTGRKFSQLFFYFYTDKHRQTKLYETETGTKIQGKTLHCLDYKHMI